MKLFNQVWLGCEQVRMAELTETKLGSILDGFQVDGGRVKPTLTTYPKK